jgi:hypothetical protein
VSGADDTIEIDNGLSATINGGEADAYSFGSTWGTDTINNIALGSDTSANGTIGFGSGVTDEKLWFKQTGNNLVIQLLDTSDTLTIDNWFGSNAGAKASSISANGLELTTAVSSLVSAMATYAAAHPSFNPSTASTMPTDTTLQSAISASWHS